MGKPAVLVAGNTIDDEDFVVSHGGNLLLIVLRTVVDGLLVVLRLFSSSVTLLPELRSKR